MDNTLLISMILVVAIVIVIPVYINVTKKKHGRNKIEGNRNTQVTGENNTTNVTNINTQNVYSTQVSGEKKEPTTEEVKARIKILFVDDKDDFPIIGMLRNNGYQVEYLDDIVDFEAKQVKYADIIFLDINGVSFLCIFVKDAPLGLA